MKKVKDVYEFLRNKGKATAKEIAEGVGVTKNYTYWLLKFLEAQGKVKRTYDNEEGVFYFEVVNNAR